MQSETSASVWFGAIERWRMAEKRPKAKSQGMKDRLAVSNKYSGEVAASGSEGPQRSGAERGQPRLKRAGGAEEMKHAGSGNGSSGVLSVVIQGNADCKRKAPVRRSKSVVSDH